MFRAYRLSAVMLVAGCSETVPLGHECPDQSEQCEPVPGAPSPPVTAAPRPPASPRTPDAGTVVRTPPAADPPPAAAPPPAPPARERPLFPDIANRSFETLATGSLTSRTDDRTAPWVGCAIGWTVVDRVFVAAPDGGAQMVEVGPSEGEAFMEYVRPEASDPIAFLSQHLETPLEPGRRYALRMDAQTSADVNVSLEVWTGSRHRDATASCEPLVRLGETDRVQPGAWRPVCVSFEAPNTSTLDELMIIANFGDAPSTNVRLFIDNIRQDPACP